MNEKQLNLNFCFKGDRKYVHGTDIFSKLTEQYSNDIKKIDISFHGITVNNMSFFTEKPENEEIKVTFRCLENDNKVRYFGIENNTHIKCRYEYIEEKIISNSTVSTSDKIITLNSATEYLFIEHIVAMNKALLEELYPEVKGKWYFTRLQLKNAINMSDITSLKLELKSNFQFKLTKSTIMVNETEVGFIYFSLIR